MSIASRMKPATLLKPVEVEGLLETAVKYEPDREIMASFSLISGAIANTNSTLYSSSTHIALTHEKGITQENRVLYNGDEYVITYVNSDGRYTELFLQCQKLMRVK